MTIEVGGLSKIVNRVFTMRPAHLSEEFVYHISLACSGLTKIKDESQLWDKMTSLLRKGANPDTRNCYGETAIEKLCEDSRHATALKLLSEYPKLKVNVARGPTPITPLMYALRDAHAPLVQALCDHGADVNAVCTTSKPSLSLTAAEFLFGNTITQVREAKAAACMKILVRHGLAPSDELKSRIFTQAPALAEALPDVQQAVDLAAALRDRDTTALKALLQKGVDFGACEKISRAPALNMAVAAGNLAAIDLLLAHGAPLENGLPVTKITPLHHAALAGEREAFIKLLDAGAKPGLLWQACHTAEMGQLDISITCADPQGMTAFVRETLTQRQSTPPEVALAKKVRTSKPLRFKQRPTA